MNSKLIGYISIGTFTDHIPITIMRSQYVQINIQTASHEKYIVSVTVTGLL